MNENVSLPEQSAVLDALRGVVDPEVGVNIVDLGLIYRVEISPEAVLVELTMTSPACPMGDMIMDDAVAALEAILPEGLAPEMRLVWEPPWSPELMSERAKSTLGW